MTSYQYSMQELRQVNQHRDDESSTTPSFSSALVVEASSTFQPPNIAATPISSNHTHLSLPPPPPHPRASELSIIHRRLELMSFLHEPSIKKKIITPNLDRDRQSVWPSFIEYKELSRKYIHLRDHDDESKQESESETCYYDRRVEGLRHEVDRYGIQVMVRGEKNDIQAWK